jgi:DNA gyrase/topoisomerase IV subunit B
MEGLTAVISVKLREIQFEGQTKAKLGTVEARGMVETVFSEAFSYFLEENPDDARAIINKVVLAVRARKAAKAAKDSVLRKGALEGMTLPGKLADCQAGTSAEESELFIVEGDSAGGTAKSGRDRRTQAVLPLRGKILNIERARLDRMLASEQIRNLVMALGTAIGDTFDISKLRYHKVIIATDADVDGAHIRTLILTLLYRFFRPLIDGGYIYIAQPPLYKIKKGKEIIASPTVFALWEDALSAAQKKKLEKLGAKLEECTAPEVKPAVDFNLFTITDAWGDRAREKAWTLFATALFKGVAPEEVFWKLVWQTKNLLLLKKTANPTATGLKPFVIQKTSRQLKNFSVPELEQLSSSLVTLWHEARRGRVDFEFGLEKLILSI